MICSLLALSLTNSFTKIGAIAAFVALLGIAILSLLVFAQGREIKRLREWAGRAPERAAEHEQRVSTQAAARVGAAQPVPAARPVPRATPLNVRAASTTAATRVATGVPVPAGSTPITAGAESAPADTTPAPEVTHEGPQDSPAPSPGTATEAPATPDSPVGAPPVPAAVAETESKPGPGIGRDTDAAESGPAQPQTDAPAQDSGPADSQAPGGDTGQTPPITPAPATAAARAVRSPLPPAPAQSSGNGEQAQTSPPVSSPSPVRPTGEAPRPPVIPTSRRAGPPSPNAATAQRRTAARAPVRPGSYKFLTEEDRRSPARTRIAILVGVVLLAVLAVVLISSLGKGGSTPSSSGTQPGLTTASKNAHSHHHTTLTGFSDPATVSVSVLNGTETNNLAHHVAGTLSEKGYTRASALNGHPPGTYPKTMVEYSSGHSADALNVANLLGISSGEVQALNPATQPLANGASVVVIAGVDEATKLSNAGQASAVQSSGSSPSGSEGGANAGGG